MHISNLEISKNHHNTVWFSLQGDCSQCSNQAINQVWILYKSHHSSSLLQLWKKNPFSSYSLWSCPVTVLWPVINWHNSHFHFYIQCDSKEFQIKWLKKKVKLVRHLNVVTFLPFFSEDCHMISRQFKAKMQTNPVLASSFNKLNFLMWLGATQHKNVCRYEPGWRLRTPDVPCASILL